jgi:hypothetical protein
MQGRSTIACLTVLALAAWAPVGAVDQTSVPLGSFRLGRLPDAIETLHSSGAEPGDWRIQRFDGRTTLSQLRPGGGGYQLAVLRSETLRDLALSVRVRTGEQGDKAAGLAWRVQDADNYFAARLDLQDRQLVLYKFVRGNRVSLDTVRDLRLDESAWHTLGVEHAGEEIHVWLNGVPVARERDGSLGPGRFGVWMPSDSTAYFDNLQYQALGERGD